MSLCSLTDVMGLPRYQLMEAVIQGHAKGPVLGCGLVLRPLLVPGACSSLTPFFPRLKLECPEDKTDE